MIHRSVRTLLATCVAAAVLASCNDDSVAGTSDEAQTSLKLQLVADNLRPIPAGQSGGGGSAGREAVAGRLVATIDTTCQALETIHEARFEEKEDQGMHWRFRLWDRTRWGCRERYASIAQEHGSMPETEWWADDTTWIEGGDPVEYHRTAQAVTRANFHFRFLTTMTPSRPGLESDQVVSTIVLGDLGWEATFRWTLGEPTPATVTGTPIVQGSTPVGRLSIDTLTGGFRVFDLHGKEYFPRAQVFPPVAADSLGVRVVGIRRDTVDGTEGLRVALVGRLPSDSGLSFGGVRISYFMGPSEDLYKETSAGLAWPVGATSASLFFPGIPSRTTHVRLGGDVLWDRPADPSVLWVGEFLTRMVPVP